MGRFLALSRASLVLAVAVVVCVVCVRGTEAAGGSEEGLFWYDAETAWEPRPLDVEHHCVHDHAVSGQVSGHGVVQQEFVSALKRASDPEDVAYGARGRVGVRHHETAGAIRILFDLSALDADETVRICTDAKVSGGEDVMIGTPAQSTDRCNATHTTSCYAQCTASMVMSDAKKAFVRDTIIPRLESALEGMLQVVSPASSITFAASGGTECGSDTYGPATIPASYMASPTTDTDLIVFVTGRPMLGGALGVGVECMQNQIGRPLAGHLNLASQYINPADENGTYHVALHEMVHLLGFSFSKMPQYLDEYGRTYAAETPSRLVTFEETTEFGNTVTKLNTPRTIAVAREHWDCAAVDGVELEDGGGSTISRSHWEKRLLMNEIMTGTYSDVPPPVLSYFTIALFEDMGWYIGNYDAAEAFHYGYHQRCAFPQSQCSSWSRSGYFCDASGQSSCDYSRTAKAECVIVEWSNIPEGFRYFNNPTTGGYSSLADFCPIYTPVAGGDCTNPANGGVHTGLAGETFAPAAQCFIATIRNSTSSYTGVEEPRCYRPTCTGSASSGFELSIEVGGSGGTTVICPTQGGQVSVPGYQGYVVCPRAEDVCATPSVSRPPVPHGAASVLAPTIFALFSLCLVSLLLLSSSSS